MQLQNGAKMEKTGGRIISFNYRIQRVPLFIFRHNILARFTFIISGVLKKKIAHGLNFHTFELQERDAKLGGGGNVQPCPWGKLSMLENLENRTWPDILMEKIREHSKDVTAPTSSVRTSDPQRRTFEDQDCLRANLANDALSTGGVTH